MSETRSVGGVSTYRTRGLFRDSDASPRQSQASPQLRLLGFLLVPRLISVHKLDDFQLESTVAVYERSSMFQQRDR